MEPFENDQLAATLHSLRPTPSPDFAAELDQRVAAGFARRGGDPASPLAGLRAWLRSLQPRRALVPAAVVAVLAVALATTVIATQEESPSDSSSLAQMNPSEQPAPAPAPAEPGAAGAAETASGGPTGSSAGGDSSGVQYGGVLPSSSPQYEADAERAVDASGAGSAAAESAKPSAGPYASDAGHREIERSAEIALGAEPEDVGADAAAVFDAVHAADGIVLSSSVRGGAEGEAGARFELLIPSARLSDALAAFSAIDLVVSRHEATDDITAPTVRSGELLRDSRARIEGLLAQLAAADSDAERAATEAQLRAERRHNANLRAQLSNLQRRSNLSRVSVRIETGVATDGEESDGGWGVGDAFEDAGHILGIAAGVTVIGLAILAPLALIALLAWLGNRARLRRARERALA